MKGKIDLFIYIKTLTILYLFLISNSFSFGQNGVPLYLSDQTKVSLLTSSPGADLYAQFGHSAIRIRDTISGQDLVFNYGLFDFNTPGFYLKFVRGKLPYQLGIQRFNDFLNNYIEEKRQLRELPLALDENQRNELINFLSINYLPENREYAYDFFFDNCATRIRDIFENKYQIQYPDTTSVKEESFRHFLAEYVGKNSWINVGFYLILGLPSDDKANFRNEMFLPEYLEKHLEKATLSKESFAKSTIEILYQGQDVRSKKSFFNPIFIAWILFLKALILTLFFSKRGVQLLEKFYFSILSLAGMLFVFMWLGTDHTVTHKNMNLLWANPLYLMLFFNVTNNRYQQILSYFLLILNLVLLIGWKFLPQEFHIAFIPLILTNILRLLAHTGFFKKLVK